MPELQQNAVTGEYRMLEDDGSVRAATPGEIAAHDVGPVEAALISAGSTIHSMATGLGLVDERTEGDREMMRALEAHRPISTTVGGMLPYMAAPSVGVGAAGLARAVALGAGQSAIDVEAGGTVADRMITGGLGGGLGHTAGRVVSRIMGPRLNVPTTAATPEHVKRFSDAGGELLPSQAGGIGAGGKARIESTLEKNVFAGQRFDEVLEHNESLLAQKATRAAGIKPVKEIQPKHLAEARARFAEIYSRAARKVGNVRMSQDFFDDVQEILPRKVSRHLPDSPDKPISGKTLGLIRSAASKKSKDPATHDQAQDILEAVMQKYRRIKGMEKEIRQTNKQYRNYLALERAFDGDKVTFRKMRNAMQQIYDKAGGDQTDVASKDLYDFATAGASRELQPRVGNSGTAERSVNVFSPWQWSQGLLGRAYLGQSPDQIMSTIGRGSGAGAAMGLLY